jgi:hypothetical protein
MAMGSLKHFVFRNKEVLMFLVGFGAMHYGWYNLQRSDTMNKAMAASRDKEMAKVSLNIYIYIFPNVFKGTWLMICYLFENILYN